MRRSTRSALSRTLHPVHPVRAPAVPTAGPVSGSSLKLWLVQLLLPSPGCPHAGDLQRPRPTQRRPAALLHILLRPSALKGCPPRHHGDPRADAALLYLNAAAPGGAVARRGQPAGRAPQGGGIGTSVKFILRMERLAFRAQSARAVSKAVRELSKHTHTYATAPQGRALLSEVEAPSPAPAFEPYRYTPAAADFDAASGDGAAAGYEPMDLGEGAAPGEADADGAAVAALAAEAERPWYYDWSYAI
eukprot:tig00020961_g16688.t1